MKVVTLKKCEIDLKEFVKRSAFEKDFTTLITEPTIIVDLETGQRVVFFDVLKGDFSKEVQALKEIEFSTSNRTGGLISTSRVIGYQPRVAMRRDFCSSASLSKEQPEQHRVICDLAVKLAEKYKELAPETFMAHEETTVNKVKPMYKMEGTPFTSGIINKNNLLKYHFDTGNFQDVYSAMIVFKHDVGGGYLSLPEYNVGFSLPDKSVLIFDGQKLMHGVTPIIKNSADGHRFSIVYYSLQQMWKCLTIDEEVARIRKVKTAREQKRTSKNIQALRTQFGREVAK